MSTTFTATRTLATATSKLDNLDVREVNEIKSPIMYTVDDLLFNQSQAIPDVPLVAYPATARGRSDYVHYTAKDLDRFADHGAQKYASLGLQPKVLPPVNIS
jgi:hypothetical protein